MQKSWRKMEMRPEIESAYPIWVAYYDLIVIASEMLYTGGDGRRGRENAR